MKAYPEYKDCNVEWIGKIPANWNLGKVSSHVDLVNGFPFNSDLFSHENGFPLIRIRDITIGKTETFYSGEYPPESLIDNNDILIGMDGDFLVRWWNGGKGVLNQRCCCLRPFDSINKRFLFYILQFPLNIINDLTYFTTVKHLSSGEIKGIKFPLPSLPEQQAIADFLDRKTAQIDTLIAKKQQQIELLQEQRTALINQVVTKGLNPNAPMKDSGVKWLGEIPSHWEISQSKWLFSIRTERARPDDIQLSATQAYGVISQEEFMRRVGRQVTQITKHLEKRGHVEIDDFVISMRSFQGGLERAWERGCIRSSYVVLQPSSKIVVNYFTYLFKSVSYIQALRATSNYLRDGQDMNFNNFSLVALPIIPESEQKEIAAFLDKKIRNIDLLVEKSNQLIDLLEEFRAGLISEVVTGKIDVRTETVHE